MFETSLLIKGQYSLVRIAFYNYFDDFHKKLYFWFHSSSNKFCFKGNTVWPLWYCLCRVFWILLILKLTFNIVYYSATSLCLTSFHGSAAWNFWKQTCRRNRITWLDSKILPCNLISQHTIFEKTRSMLTKDPLLEFPLVYIWSHSPWAIWNNFAWILNENIKWNNNRCQSQLYSTTFSKHDININIKHDI